MIPSPRYPPLTQIYSPPSNHCANSLLQCGKRNLHGHPTRGLRYSIFAVSYKIVTSSNQYSKFPVLTTNHWLLYVTQYLCSHLPCSCDVQFSISWMICLEKPGIVIQQHNTSSAASLMYLKSLKTSISGVSTFVQLYSSGPPTHFTNDSKTEVKLKLWLNC